MFGRLKVIEHSHTINKISYWKCACSCGNEVIVAGRHLRYGSTKSCGCLSKEIASITIRINSIDNTKHNHACRNDRSPTYNSWDSMIQRCTNPNHPAYQRYGEKGISVCDRWLVSFQNFLEDMEERPKNKTLDRYPDRHGNYEPGNCRWATVSEQNYNKDTKLIEFAGKKQTLNDWARDLGVTKSAICRRIRVGWSLEKTLTTRNLKE